MSDSSVKNKKTGLVNELMAQRYLLWSFVHRDLKMRYGASSLGIFWSVINPLLLIGIYTLVFGYLLDVNIGGSGGSKSYGVFLFSGMLPWLAFSESVAKSSTIIVENRDLVKQVTFSTILLPTHVIISAFLHEMIAMVLFLGVLVFMGHPPTILLLGMLTIFPLQIFFTLGISLVVGSTAVFYRDVRELAPALLTIWFFLTPIVYPMSAIPAWLIPIYSLNPLTPLINIYRSFILGDSLPDLWGFCYFASWSVFLFFSGIKIFRRLSAEFADLL
jgi:lipopolysaccharide transport system permease protein